MEYPNLFGQLGEVLVAESPGQYVKQQLAITADNLSKAGHVAGQCLVVNEALLIAVSLLYQKDADGAWSNVDAVTYRIMIPMPWCSCGWRHYGLRQWQGRVLRTILVKRVGERSARPALFDYNAEGNSWHLDIASYSNAELAARFMKLEVIKLSEWRHYARLFREREVNRKNRHTS